MPQPVSWKDSYAVQFPIQLFLILTKHYFSLSLILCNKGKAWLRVNSNLLPRPDVNAMRPKACPLVSGG